MSDYQPLLPGLILLLPLFGFLANGVLALVAGVRSANALRLVGGGESQDAGAGSGGGHEPGKRALTQTLPTWIGPGVMGAAFLLTLANFLGMAGAEPAEAVVVTYWRWMATGTFSVDAALHLDQLAMIMMLIITGVGFLIHLFSVGYMKEDPGYARYFAYLNLFVFFMLILVMGSSFPLMFVGWEGVGLCSYLLIGFWFGDREKADAGKKAFIVNRVGDFGFLIAIFLLFAHLGVVAYVGVF
ncbi:MAG: proton-conducting transporter membrane subunit, partial [Gemmatimonadota bacterium]